MLRTKTSKLVTAAALAAMTLTTATAANAAVPEGIPGETLGTTDHAAWRVTGNGTGQMLMSATQPGFGNPEGTYLVDQAAPATFDFGSTPELAKLQAGYIWNTYMDPSLPEGHSKPVLRTSIQKVVSTIAGVTSQDNDASSHNRSVAMASILLEQHNKDFVGSKPATMTEFPSAQLDAIVRESLAYVNVRKDAVSVDVKHAGKTGATGANGFINGYGFPGHEAINDFTVTATDAAGNVKPLPYATVLVRVKATKDHSAEVDRYKTNEDGVLRLGNVHAKYTSSGIDEDTYSYAVEDWESCPLVQTTPESNVELASGVTNPCTKRTIEFKTFKPARDGANGAHGWRVPLAEVEKSCDVEPTLKLRRVEGVGYTQTPLENNMLQVDARITQNRYFMKPDTPTSWVLDMNPVTDCDKSIEVTPIEPQVIPSTQCDAQSTLETYRTTGVEYDIQIEGNIATITAVALEGYKFAEGVTTSWELDISPQTECEPEPEDVLAVPVAPELIPADECGVASTVKLAETQGIEYAMVTTDNKAIITATALEGYKFAEGAVTSWELDLAPVEDCEPPVVDPKPEEPKEEPKKPETPKVDEPKPLAQTGGASAVAFLAAAGALVAGGVILLARRYRSTEQ